MQLTAELSTGPPRQHSPSGQHQTAKSLFLPISKAPHTWPCRQRQLSSENTQDLHLELNTAGAGIADDFYLQDLLRDDFPIEQYSVLIIPDLYAPSAEIRAAIDSKCKNRQRTLIFGYGAGMFLEHKLSEQGMVKLTGQTFNIDPAGQVQVPGSYKVGPAITPVSVQKKRFRQLDQNLYPLSCTFTSTMA